MNRVLKIIIVIVVVGIVGGVIYAAYLKKRDKKDKAILGDRTREDFFKEFIPVWKDKWVEGSTSSGLNNDKWVKELYLAANPKAPEFRDFAVLEKNAVYAVENYPSEAAAYMKEAVEQTIREYFGKAFYEDKPNPIEVPWANTYWMPVQLNMMGIEIHKDGVKDIINKTPKYIKK